MVMLTVKDVLSLEIMGSARVRSGKGVVNERCVQWISVIEMPVENFVRKNEFVLSTAIGCGDDTDTLKQFVQDIIDSNASALVLALGRHVFSIPKEVLQLAERQNFIIIELPWEVRFANVIHDVMQQLNGLHYKELEQSERTQQQLLKLILQGAELNQIARFVQENVECSVVITDHAGKIKGTSQHAHPAIKEWKDPVTSGKIVPANTSLFSNDPMFQKIKKVEMAETTLLQLPIMKPPRDVQGYLYALLPAKTSVETFLTQERVNVLEHAVTTAALWFSKENAIEDTEMRLRSDFILELATGEFSSGNHAKSRAKSLGMNLNVPYIGIVGFPENLRALFQKRNEDVNSYDHWHENMIHYIEEEIEFAVQSLNREVMVSSQEGHIIIFLEARADKKGENVNHLLDLIERRLRHLLPEVAISWGIGNYHEGLNGFRKSYENAKVALEIGRRQKGRGRRVMYEDTRIDRLLLSLADNADIKEVVESTIKPLIEYDGQGSMDLIETFISYNRNHGNVSQTARCLNLHRQSLLYRLRKIESLTGLSLIDPDNLFLLDLSIKIWNIGNAEKRKVLE